MKIELVQALEVLKENCKENEDCRDCDLYNHEIGCYLYDKAPEEYDIDRLEEEIED